MKKFTGILFLFVMASSLWCEEVIAKETLSDKSEFITTLYSYGVREMEFSDDGTPNPLLLQLLGYLEAYTELRFKGKAPETILKYGKEMYMKRNLNFLVHQNPVNTADELVLYLPEPKQWSSPTIYISETLLDANSPKGASWLIRAIAESYYDKVLSRESGKELKAVQRKLYGLQIQGEFLEATITIDAMAVSRYESSLFRSWKENTPSLSSFLTWNYLFDTSSWDKLITYLEKPEETEDFIEELKDITSEAEKIIAGGHVLADPEKNTMMDNYLRYTFTASFYYHSQLIAEELLAPDFSHSWLSSYKKSLNEAREFLESYREEFLSLRSHFSEDLRDFYPVITDGQSWF